MYKITINLPACLGELEVAFLGEALADLCLAHSALREGNNHQAPWVIEWLVDTIPEDHEIASRLALKNTLHGLGLDDLSWQVAEIPDDVNWLEESYRDFPAFSVGPFYIYGSHCSEPVPDGLMGLQIDAATAFGSGEHGTTKGCLQAMLDLKGAGQCPWNVLDMGTGSGILAVAAWKLWETPILAVDNDAEAVRVSAHHAQVNDVPLSGAALVCAVGDGFKSVEAQEKKPYELVIANILASALLEMVGELVAVMDDHGYVILSGILNEQASSVISAYEAAGLALKKSYEIGEWTSLVMQK